MLSYVKSLFAELQVTWTTWFYCPWQQSIYNNVNHNTYDKYFNLLKQRSFCKTDLIVQIIIWLGSSSQYKLLKAILHENWLLKLHHDGENLEDLHL